MLGLSMPELIVIVLVALLLFGAKKLPELGRSVGRTLTEFKKGVHEINSAMEVSATEADKQPLLKKDVTKEAIEKTGLSKAKGGGNREA